MRGLASVGMCGTPEFVPPTREAGIGVRFLQAAKRRKDKTHGASRG